MVPVQVLEGLSILSMKHVRTVITDDKLVQSDVIKYGNGSRHSKIGSRLDEVQGDRSQLLVLCTMCDFHDFGLT